MGAGYGGWGGGYDCCGGAVRGVRLIDQVKMLFY